MTKQNPSYRRTPAASPLTRARHRICRWLGKDILFNPDMSLEIDRLQQENDLLRAHLRDRHE